MKQFFYLGVLLCVAIGVSSCGSKNDKLTSSVASRPEVRASDLVGESFAFLSQKELNLDVKNYLIEIKHKALEKEFLLQTSMAPQPGVALGNGLKSRIVSFRERGNQIIMLEATQGHIISSDIPQNFVLAVFPIVKKEGEGDEQVIQFDFNKGMSKLFVMSDWHASDFDGNQYNPVNNFKSVNVSQSYLEEVKIDNNHMIIRQIVQAPYAGLEGESDPVYAPMEVKYYLTPYRPSDSFKEYILNQDFKHMGFFELAPIQPENNWPINKVAKFDETKPIIYAISANTPAEFKQAVIDGVLYWNKAFGKEVVKVIDAPQGVTAPDLNYNVIQWVKWDDAGFAYADAQLDPRNGEVLHAQIYFTSAFAVMGKWEARNILKNFQDKILKKRGIKTKRAGLSGLLQENLCQMSLPMSYFQSLSKLVNSNASDEMILKASQDYVREVAAHEVGHTLGLRHNFAGSLAANYSKDEREELIKKYFTEKKADSTIKTTSSVMEYQLFEEAAISGDLMTQGNVPAFSYDDKAIKTLYLNENFKDDEIPLFCTDTHATGTFIDCGVFDFGKNIFDTFSYSERNLNKDTISWIVNAYVFAKSPFGNGTRKPLPVEKVELMPAEWMGLSYLSNRYGMLKMLNGKTRILKIERSLPSVDGGNNDEVLKEELNTIIDELTKVGGVDQFISDVDSSIGENLYDAFEKLMEKNRSGIGPNNQPFEFSSQEMLFIKEKVKKYLMLAGKEIAKANLFMLSGKDLWSMLSHEESKEKGIRFADHSKLNSLINDYSKVIEKFLLTEKGETFKIKLEFNTEKNGKKEIIVPVYHYAYDLRLRASALINAEVSDYPFWATIKKKKLLKIFDEKMKKILGMDLSDLKAEDMQSDEAALWVMENQNIRKAFE